MFIKKSYFILIIVLGQLSLYCSEMDIVNGTRKILNTKLFNACDGNLTSMHFTRIAIASGAASITGGFGSNTLLHYAAQHNDCALFEFLITIKKDVIGELINKQNQPFRQTALHSTVKHNNYLRTKALLELQADPTIKDYKGITPLMLSKTVSSKIHSLVYSYTFLSEPNKKNKN